MRCENKDCQRELTAREPVYRWLVHHAVIHVCGDCASKRQEWDPAAKYYDSGRDVWGNLHQPRTWREPRTCENCCRPVIHDGPAPTIIACSRQCRQAIYNKNRRRASWAICAECGGMFSPKRSDAEYCSGCVQAKGLSSATALDALFVASKD